ncbi:MAG TPA: fructose PTS transporter subunit IIA [Nitrospirota bacterium]|nr:fructose PTS transporter subunit IIA [Nitrospirota bacterium]
MAKIIGDLLQDDLVIEEIKATDKIGVIREFAEILQATGRVTDAEALVRVLLERESLGSTGIGDGVAIPHGKLNFISNMVVAFGRSSRGVDFQSLDAKPVYLFFLLVTPDNKPGDHLKALARISRILKNPDLRENLKRTSDRQELKRLIYEEDSKYPQK